MAFLYRKLERALKWHVSRVFSSVMADVSVDLEEACLHAMPDGYQHCPNLSFGLVNQQTQWLARETEKRRANRKHLARRILIFTGSYPRYHVAR